MSATLSLSSHTHAVAATPSSGRLGTGSIRDGLLCLVALLGIASCATPPGHPTQTGIEHRMAEAESLSREGKYQDSAQVYEAIAAAAPRDLHDRLLLRAAREYVRAGATEKASAQLSQISANLPSQDLSLRAQVAAELALRAQHPKQALSELSRIPQPPPSADAPEILGLKARALFALNRPVDAVGAALEREQLLSSQPDIRANQQLIWQGLQQSATGNAKFTPPAGSSALLTGWLDLGRAALTAARNPFAAKNDLADWHSRHPNHPANSFLNEVVLPELGVGLDYPAQMALVLPLSGKQQAAGVAVRDGFMAALLQQQTSQRPRVDVYDSAALGASTAYGKAIADGAQFVVGPLMKDDVVAVAASNQTSVLTLALNRLPETTTPPAMMFQFALDPEEEARQVAQRAVADGRLRGLVLLPNNEWGQRLHRAFDAELATLGGAVAGVRYFDPSARDFSAPITQLLLVDESRARAKALNAVLGQRLEFEPRRRGDAQFIFIGAFPAQGRSLRPALRFFLGDDLPVYATSDIFEPDTQANDDLDGVLFPDMPWVISPDAVSLELRTALSKYWPARARGRGRLYAFGFDAYRIAPLLRAGKIGREYAIAGMTGRLSLDDRGRVRRELDWARVDHGRPVPLGAAVALEGSASGM